MFTSTSDLNPNFIDDDESRIYGQDKDLDDNIDGWFPSEYELENPKEQEIYGVNRVVVRINDLRIK